MCKCLFSHIFVFCTAGTCNFSRKVCKYYGNIAYSPFHSTLRQRKSAPQPDSERMRSLLKYCKTVLTLLLCVCLLSAVCVPALATDVPAASAAEILGEYGELFGGVLDSVREWSAEDGAQFTDELRGMLEQYDLDTLGDDLKTVLDSAAAMSDEELAAAISGLAEQHGVKLLDSQIEQLCQLCRGLEKFSG